MTWTTILENGPGSTAKSDITVEAQHLPLRCRVMERLHRHTDRDIKFQFRAKAVSDSWRRVHLWFCLDLEFYKFRCQSLMLFLKSYPRCVLTQVRCGNSCN